MIEDKLEQLKELMRACTENVSVNHWTPAIHEDKHEALAEEIVKLFSIQVVSKPFIDGANVEITDNASGHGFYIGEIVIIIDFEPNYSQWLCEGDNGKRWYINDHEGNVF